MFCVPVQDAELACALEGSSLVLGETRGSRQVGGRERLVVHGETRAQQASSTLLSRWPESTSKLTVVA